MASLEQLLGNAEELTGDAVAEGVRDLSDSRLVVALELVEQLGRRVDTLRVAAAAEVAERSRHELGSGGLSWRWGHRRPQHLIEQVTRVSGAEVARRVRLGGLIRVRQSLDGVGLPPLYGHVAEAVASGQLGVDAALAITRNLEQAAPRCAPDDLFEAERTLVGNAATESADLVAGQARLWRDALDADGGAPREEELRERAEFQLGRERNGMTPFSGLADPLGAATLRAMLDTYGSPGGSPRFLSADAEAARVGEDAADRATLPVDARSPARRNFDILIGVIMAGLGADRSAPHSKTRIVITTRKEDFDSGAGVGWIDGVVEPLSTASIRELACDADLRLLTVGSKGEVLALGRSSRFFSPAQRAALAARDGGCISGPAAPPRPPGPTHTTSGRGKRAARRISTTERSCARHTTTCSMPPAPPS